MRANTIMAKKQPGYGPAPVGADETDRTILFGPFRLLPRRRVLLENDRPVRLGSRALEVLIALLERPGELIGKEEIIVRVWPNMFVAPANLTVQVAALRRAFGDGQGGYRYVVTIPGQGYRFVAPVRIVESSIARAHEPATVERRHNLPAPVIRLLGRAETVSAVAARLPSDRLITIAGPGGVGKTAVALRVAEGSLANYRDGVWLIDLASVSSAPLVPTALASALGLEIRTEDPLPDVINLLKDKQMLLVMDNCEQVVEAIATLTVDVLKAAPSINILATSREPLRAEGEHVHRLLPLAVPPSSTRPTAGEALAFPSVQLFVERVRDTAHDFELTDADAPAIVEICRNLDGLPLAIQFAAARVEGLGIQGVANRLDDRLRVLTNGRRTAMPRHQTMSAVLDWSFALLAEAEQKIFQRLAIFSGGFTLAAAGTVAADATLWEGEVVDLVALLVAKSLVSIDISDAEPRLRLLETTRAYALARLSESGEADMLGRRHAEYYRDLLEFAQQNQDLRGLTASLGPEIDNIRAALAWAFSPRGDEAIGVAVAAASAALWLEMSLLAECHVWMGKAIAVLPTVAADARREMLLQAAFGISRIFTMGMTDDVHHALARAAELADGLADTDYQLRILRGLWLYHFRVGKYQTAAALARRSQALAARADDPIALATADRMAGTSLHLLGHQVEARALLERALTRQASAPRRAGIVRFGLNQSALAKCILANVLWVQGLPDQATRMGATSIDEAKALENPVSLCLALKWGGCMMSLEAGNLSAAERDVAELIRHANIHSLSADYACGLGLRGDLALRRGDIGGGVRLLRAALDGLRQTRIQTLHSMLLGSLANGLAAAGNITEGLAAIDAVLTRVESDGELWFLPEALRLKGALLLMRHRAVDAENLFLRSLDFARRQGALSWELRSTVSLARLQCGQGRAREAHGRLMSVYSRFTEGFETADVQEAKQLLDELIKEL
jgi:predicted ATPase/DNA-binding winged helix-turn-helix (wHTH) protein